MDRTLLATEMIKLQRAMKQEDACNEVYSKRLGVLGRLQEMELREREMDLKEKTETSKAQSEWRKIEISDKEQDNKAIELRNKDRNDKRQVALSYAKILIGTAGTVGSILLVTVCEEEKILRSKAYQFVKNFAVRFI